MHDLIAKLNLFVRHSQVLLENLKLHEDDANWNQANAEQIKSELKGLKTEITWMVNLLGVEDEKERKWKKLD